MGYCNGTKLNAFPKNPTDLIKLEHEIPRSLSIVMHLLHFHFRIFKVLIFSFIVGLSVYIFVVCGQKSVYIIFCAQTLR